MAAVKPADRPAVREFLLATISFSLSEPVAKGDITHTAVIL